MSPCYMYTVYYQVSVIILLPASSFFFSLVICALFLTKHLLLFCYRHCHSYAVLLFVHFFSPSIRYYFVPGIVTSISVSAPLPLSRLGFPLAWLCPQYSCVSAAHVRLRVIDTEIFDAAPHVLLGATGVLRPLALICFSWFLMIWCRGKCLIV